MSVEAVKTYLSRWGAQDRIQEFPVSSATVTEAAAALHCAEAHIAKTMSFLVDGKAVLIVMAGDVKTDNAKFKARFHTKAVMLKPEEVEPLTGHPAGGVCPFSVHHQAEVYLDESLRRFDYVYPACGSRNSAIKLTPGELELFTGNPGWIDVTKSYETASETAH